MTAQAIESDSESVSGVQRKAALRVSRRGIFIAWAILTLSLAVAFSVMGPLGWSWHGDAGFRAAAIAAGICWGAGSVSLILTLATQGGQQAVGGVLLGMLVRMAPPLAFLMFSGQGWLAEASLSAQILTFYFVTLAVETSLIVWCLSKALPKREVC